MTSRPCANLTSLSTITMATSPAHVVLRQRWPPMAAARLHTHGSHVGRRCPWCCPSPSRLPRGENGSHGQLGTLASLDARSSRCRPNIYLLSPVARPVLLSRHFLFLARPSSAIAPSASVSGLDTNSWTDRTRFFQRPDPPAPGHPSLHAAAFVALPLVGFSSMLQPLRDFNSPCPPLPAAVKHDTADRPRPPTLPCICLVSPRTCSSASYSLAHAPTTAQYMRRHE